MIESSGCHHQVLRMFKGSDFSFGNFDLLLLKVHNKQIKSSLIHFLGFLKDIKPVFSVFEIVAFPL